MRKGLAMGLCGAVAMSTLLTIVGKIRKKRKQAEERRNCRIAATKDAASARESGHPLSDADAHTRARRVSQEFEGVEKGVDGRSVVREKSADQKYGGPGTGNLGTAAHAEFEDRNAIVSQEETGSQSFSPRELETPKCLPLALSCWPGWHSRSRSFAEFEERVSVSAGMERQACAGDGQSVQLPAKEHVSRFVNASVIAELAEEEDQLHAGRPGPADAQADVDDEQWKEFKESMEELDQRVSGINKGYSSIVSYEQQTTDRMGLPSSASEVVLQRGESLGGLGEGWDIMEQLLGQGQGRGRAAGGEREGDKTPEFFDAQEGFLSESEERGEAAKAYGYVASPRSARVLEEAWDFLKQLVELEESMGSDSAEGQLGPAAPLSSEQFEALFGKEDAEEGLDGEGRMETRVGSPGKWRSSAGGGAASQVEGLQDVACRSSGPAGSHLAEAQTARRMDPSAGVAAVNGAGEPDDLEEASALLKAYIARHAEEGRGEADSLADADLAEGSECGSPRLEVSQSDMAALAQALAQAPWITSRAAAEGSLAVPHLRIVTQGLGWEEDGDPGREAHETLWFHGMELGTEGGSWGSPASGAEDPFEERLNLDQMIALMEEVVAEGVAEDGPSPSAGAWEGPSNDVAPWQRSRSGSAISVA